MALLNNDSAGQMDIVVSRIPKLFGGMDAYDGQRYLQKLINFGRLHKCHYLVSMMPYLPKSPLLDTDMSELLGTSLDDQKAIWHLATQVEFPVFQTDTDSVKAGSFQVNRVTGQQSSESKITFLETEEALILNGMKAAKQTKFVQNQGVGLGLQRPPAQTAIRLRVVLFGREGYELQAYSDEVLVEVQSVDALSLAGNDSGPIEVGVTFMQLDPFMR